MRNTLISYYINKENKGFSELLIRYAGFYPRPSYIVVDQFLQLLPYNFLFFGSHLFRGSFF